MRNNIDSKRNPNPHNTIAIIRNWDMVKIERLFQVEIQLPKIVEEKE